MVDVLKNTYYDFSHPGSFGGVRRLAKASGFSMSKVRNWLMSQDVYTLHKPLRKTFPRRKTIALGERELYQADLVDLKHLSRFNEGFKYLLTTIDVFTKYAYVVPLKNKKPNSVINALKEIFQSSKPQKLQTDKGKEFFNGAMKQFLRQQNVHHYASHGDTKCSVVERFHRTLKNKMYRVFTYRNSYKYIDVLKDIVASYNKSYHRSIGMSPADVKPIHHSKIFMRLYGYTTKTLFRFNTGDFVRISKLRRTFQRGYLPAWTEEVFVVHERYETNPPTYKLRDLKGEDIEGRFYQEELQKVKKSDHSYWSIEKILRTRGEGRNKEYFVKWTGFDSSFNSWIKEKWLQ